MAFETGTATDHEDLFDKLIAFLTTNTDLVSAGEEWSQVWTAPGGAENESAVVLEGSVGSGDPPKIGIQLYEDAANSRYEIQLNGMVNTLNGAELLTEHANASELTRIFADPNPMTYWFTANGRRFVVVVKISAVYSSGYFGFFLPYALPTTYPYPLLVSGAAGLGSNQISDWRSLSDAHASLALPSAFTGNTSQVRPPTAHALSPAAQWERIITPTAAGSNTSLTDSNLTFFPFYDLDARHGNGNRPHANVALGLQIEAFGGAFATHPITLVRKTPASQAYGVLDGVVACQGRNNAAENTITIGSDTYRVFQDAFRSDVDRYCAVIQE